MARSANQKLKLLYLCQILTQQTDEEHPMTVQEPSASCTGSCSTCGGCH